MARGLEAALNRSFIQSGRVSLPAACKYCQKLTNFTQFLLTEVIQTKHIHPAWAARGRAGVRSPLTWCWRCTPPSLPDPPATLPQPEAANSKLPSTWGRSPFCSRGDPGGCSAQPGLPAARWDARTRGEAANDQIPCRRKGSVKGGFCKKAAPNNELCTESGVYKACLHWISVKQEVLVWLDELPDLPGGEGGFPPGSRPSPASPGFTSPWLLCWWKRAGSIPKQAQETGQKGFLRSQMLSPYLHEAEGFQLLEAGA